MSNTSAELAVLREKESGLMAAVATAEHAERANSAKLAKLRQQHDNIHAQMIAAATAAALGEEDGQDGPSRAELQDVALLIAGCEAAQITLSQRTEDAKVRLAGHEKDIKRVMRQTLDNDVRSAVLEEWNSAWDQVIRTGMHLIAIDRFLFTECDDNRFSPSHVRITGSPAANMLDDIRKLQWDHSSYPIRPACFPRNTAFQPFRHDDYLASAAKLKHDLNDEEISHDT